MTKKSIKNYNQNPFFFKDTPLRKTYSRKYNKHSQYITMRDGVKIAVEIVLPEGLSSNHKIPIMLMQTRYWRNYILRAPFRWFLKEVPDKKELYRFSALRGYGIVYVDVRGTGTSFGTRPYPWFGEEVEDGKEIIDWIISQPWSNGQIVTMGGSYLGGTAENVASLNHPAVRAIFPYSNQWDVYTEVAYPGGAYNHYFIRIWGLLGRGLDQNSSKKFLNVFPLLYFIIKGVKPVDSDEDGLLLKQAVKEHSSNTYVFEHEGVVTYRDDPLSEQETDSADNVSVFSKKELIEKSKVPFLCWAGWYDGAAASNIINRFMTYNNLMRAVIGDWDHGMRRRANPYFPKKYTVNPDKEEQMKSWFDFFDICLSSKAEFSEKVLYYYTMGEEKWKKTLMWTPKGQEFQIWYFNENKSLTLSKPKMESGEDKYKVDFNMSSGKRNRWHVHYAQKMDYTNRKKLDEKLLNYTSKPLQEDIEITGHPIVTIYLKSTHEDGVLFAYLEDLDENGTVIYITEGILRFIHRRISSETPPYKIIGPYHSFKRKDSLPMILDKITELSFGFWPTSVLVRKGHRLRVAIAGADKDTFARYPTKGVPVISIQRNNQFSSSIEIPIIQRK